MEEQLIKLKERIPYEADKYESEENYNKYLNSLLEDSLDIALHQLYPFTKKLPELSQKYYGWQIRACVELDQNYGFNGLKSYSENGLSFSKANDGMISNSLLNLLVPYAGIPEREDENVQEQHI